MVKCLRCNGNGLVRQGFVLMLCVCSPLAERPVPKRLPDGRCSECVKEFPKPHPHKFGRNSGTNHPVYLKHLKEVWQVAEQA
jgi:hypothetical protein